MKKFICLTVLMFLLVSCNANDSVTVISREDGSGTRSAFTELFGIEQTTSDAEITNSTSVMMMSVSGNKNAIGYISLGSLNDTVTAVKIDGVDATVANIKNGSYKISRPFIIVTNGSVTSLTQDFIDYIMSADGQTIVESKGYISIDTETAYTDNMISGTITIAGSSSVTPVMEALAESYMKRNTNASIEIQTSDSTTGVTSTVEKICDIGMVSRELKDSELEKGVSGLTIAMDGIAVIVNNDSTMKELTSEQVRQIFSGEPVKLP